MAEILIVIALLGIVAAITIPMAMRNNTTAQNRVKVKKAMTVYERMFNEMIMWNNLQSSSAISAWADGAANHCANTSVHFKKTVDEGCVFRTSDGIWWNITDIQRPYIAFKKENLIFSKADDFDDMDAFVLVGRIEDLTGTVRVDDLQFETNDPDRNSDRQVAKLYGFMSKKTKNDNKEKVTCRASVRNQGNAQICGNPDNGQVSTYTEYCNAEDVGQGGCTKVGDLRYTEVYTYDDTGLQVEVHTRDYRQKQGGNDYRTRNPDGTCTEHYEQISLPSESLKWQWTHTNADCKINVPDFNNQKL